MCCRSFQDFSGGHGSGLRTAGLRRAIRCMRLTHTSEAAAMHCVGLTHIILELQATSRWAVRLPFECNSVNCQRATGSRSASPAVMDSLSGGGCPSGPPARDPASLHRFPSRVPRPTSGALPWQTHRHSVSGLVCASRLELRMLIMDMQLRQHSIFGWLTRTLDEATLVSGRHTRIHWNRLDIPFRS